MKWPGRMRAERGAPVLVAAALAAAILASPGAGPASAQSGPGDGDSEAPGEDRADEDWADDDWADDDWGDEADDPASGGDGVFGFRRLPVAIHGFLEGAVGARVVDDETQPGDFVLGEARFQLGLSHERSRGRGNLRLDVIGDAVTGDVDLDLREALVFLRATDWLEISGGRQILTWGTGDFVFLNDLFPKDFVSFFNGRADEYLKAPMNAVKLGFFSDTANLEFVWTPVFEPDRVITGQRLSYFNPITGTIVGSGTPFETVRPASTLANGEFAARLYRNVRGIEAALYGYYGFFPQPTAFDPTRMLPTYARLGAYGASLRSTLLGGIGSTEFAWYDSVDDRDGTDPTLPNSQVRVLVGFEREVVAKLTLGGQYYLEYTLEHDALLASSPSPQFEPDEARHLLTFRVTYLAMNDDLTLSLFAFVSPSDVDTHIRPTIGYKISDEIRWDLGANLMFGREQDTFFGQLEGNTNIYTRLRYSF